jgi:ArsR family transcriptional regulator, cadmium/lead-responsive transcriptional repressor
MAVASSLDLATLTRVGTALADPIRRRVLVRLLDGPAYPTELADALGTTRANLQPP